MKKCHTIFCFSNPHDHLPTLPVSPSLLTMIKNIRVPPKPIHHCAEGHETEGTLLKSSAYINDVESAKL